jgi:hypothetical protein
MPQAGPDGPLNGRSVDLAPPRRAHDDRHRPKVDGRLRRVCACFCFGCIVVLRGKQKQFDGQPRQGVPLPVHPSKGVGLRIGQLDGRSLHEAGLQMMPYDRFDSVSCIAALMGLGALIGRRLFIRCCCCILELPVQLRVQAPVAQDPDPVQRARVVHAETQRRELPSGS